MVPVSREEIIKVVQELPSDKAPGIDGYPAEFFKENWQVIGKDVIKAVMEFFDTGKLLKEINCTTITLIPKVVNPNFVKEFRPIACCSTMYKIIAKLLTNRLKLDSNAGMGIPYKMVNLIMECVSTVSYSLLINGGLTPKFSAKKGLRQGHPMSPYLFVLVMEYLNRALKQLNSNPDFNYHPNCAKLGVIHICFADDLLMCCRADRVSIELMMKQFEKFSTVSGLQANMEKSSLYVAGISTQYREEILKKEADHWRNTIQILWGSIVLKEAQHQPMYATGG
ncbi:PREDICTED: uncharacterized protein LOC109209032 [Nicotiana attenuata]|uniref:uncharacterized protein LOC109209032 n=1 Tax=Nicotiana attenuata TaxID=49451 RepID=UPI0009050C99|nr:PREDICTED: uncharacterized protein LOC109209032 [Nicotiana attenuata]